VCKLRFIERDEGLISYEKALQGPSGDICLAIVILKAPSTLKIYGTFVKSVFFLGLYPSDSDCIEKIISSAFSRTSLHRSGSQENAQLWNPKVI
jgi:hypothetical protein